MNENENDINIENDSQLQSQQLQLHPQQDTNHEQQGEQEQVSFMTKIDDMFNVKKSWKMYLLLFVIAVAIYLFTTPEIKKVRFANHIVTKVIK